MTVVAGPVIDRGPGAGVWRSVLRRPLAVAAAVYLLAVIVAAVAAPVLAPYNPTQIDLAHVLSGPSGLHLLGTDSLGRDVLSRLMYGGRVSLLGVAVAVGTFLVLGVPAGLVAGFTGGWTDRVTSWVIDVMMAIPVIITLLVVLSVVGSNETAAMITVGVLTAPGLARVVRGTTLAVRQELYVTAARVAGLPSWRIITGQVLPRVTGPIIVQASLGAGGALLAQAGIEFLGLGAQPPTPTWGGMVSDASDVLDRQPWLLVPTGLTIGLAILAFGLLGDAVRDAAAGRTSGGARTKVSRPPARRPSRARTPRKGRQAPAAAAAGLAAPADAVLSLRGVSLTLPTRSGLSAVISDVDLDIGAGETVGLVGESGCGKSLTGRTILGLLPPGGRITAGQIMFDGTDLTTLSPQAWRRARGRGIALVSQEPIGSLDPMFRVEHQVGELLRRHHGGSRTAVRARVLELLSKVRLPDPETVARRYPHQLSGGMAQRVALAIALAGNPRLLIADEPTTALDVTVQAEILGLLQALQAERGMAVLLISHDWDVIATMCQRAYVMYAGHIVESAPVTALLDEPRHPYTAGLLGCSPRRARPRTVLHAIKGTVPSPEDWPHGCHFEPRCPLAAAECTSGPVSMAEPEAGHLTRCLHHRDVAPPGPVAPGRPA
jgi:peptide/nickel transport system permease protein